MEPWIVGLIAVVATLLGVWWQAGGHLTARRRRLHQELEILDRLPEGTSVRADMAVHTMTAARRYLRWSRRPLWRRLLGGATFLVVWTMSMILQVAYVALWIERGRLLPPLENPLPTPTVGLWIFLGVVAVLAGIGFATDRDSFSAVDKPDLEDEQDR